MLGVYRNLDILLKNIKIYTQINIELHTHTSNYRQPLRQTRQKITWIQLRPLHEDRLDQVSVFCVEVLDFPVKAVF